METWRLFFRSEGGTSALQGETMCRNVQVSLSLNNQDHLLWHTSLHALVSPRWCPTLQTARPSSSQSFHSWGRTSLMGLTLTGSIQPTEEAHLRINSTLLFSCRFVHNSFLFRVYFYSFSIICESFLTYWTKLKSLWCFQRTLMNTRHMKQKQFTTWMCYKLWSPEVQLILSILYMLAFNRSWELPLRMRPSRATGLVFSYLLPCRLERTPLTQLIRFPSLDSKNLLCVQS